MAAATGTGFARGLCALCGLCGSNRKHHRALREHRENTSASKRLHYALLRPSPAFSRPTLPHAGGLLAVDLESSRRGNAKIALLLLKPFSNARNDADCVAIINLLESIVGQMHTVDIPQPLRWKFFF